MGTKKITKNSKNSFFVGKIQLGTRKERVLSIKSVLEDILNYHLVEKKSFKNFCREKKFQKNTNVNFVGPDPRLMELGAK